ncbi:MAG: VWA domain-containing protein, partial [Eubacteriales bacterium]|nr:VWA domain-containing protein [Eubacteriales bacterium]
MYQNRMGLALVLLLLATCAIGTAGAQESAETGYSVDAVIVMDQSDSMNGSEAKVKNDPYNNRLDAAAMFIAMCDMNGSRVAFVPFAGTVQSYGDNDLVDISSLSVRTDKIAQIDALRNKSTASDTDLGAALSKAVDMLLKRTDTANKPMIVVLTDGDNSLTNERRYAYKSAYVWNEAAQRFIYTKFTGDYNTAMADKLMRS